MEKLLKVIEELYERRNVLNRQLQESIENKNSFEHSKELYIAIKEIEAELSACLNKKKGWNLGN